MARPFPRLCATCRQRTVQPVTLQTYATSVEHDGRSYEIVLSQVSGTRCLNCQALILEDEVSNRIDDQLRELAGLLSPQEIRLRRQALGLSLETLAQWLRIGPATLGRWETGHQIQGRAADLLLRLYSELPEARAFALRSPQLVESGR